MTFEALQGRLPLALLLRPHQPPCCSSSPSTLQLKAFTSCHHSRGSLPLIQGLLPSFPRLCDQTSPSRETSPGPLLKTATSPSIRTSCPLSLLVFLRGTYHHPKELYTLYIFGLPYQNVSPKGTGIVRLFTCLPIAEDSLWHRVGP